MRKGIAAIEVEARRRRKAWEIADELYHNPRAQAASAFLAALGLDLALPRGTSGSVAYILVTLWFAERHVRSHAMVSVLGGVLIHGIASLARGSFNPLELVIQAAAGTIVVQHLAHHIRQGLELRHMATHDSLTGCATRKAFEAFATDRITECIARDLPFTMAVLDCDKFKALNDTHGHAYGDEVLKLLAKFVRAEFGAHCMLGRMGGDEFVLAAPNMNVFEVDERLSKAVKAFGDETLCSGGKASFSFGLAGSEEGNVFYSRYLRAADEDMYRRKALKSMANLFEISA